jgi:hypothetical protein
MSFNNRKDAQSGPIFHPIAFCIEHGFFPASAVAFGGEAPPITIKGISTNCPICQGPSEIIPGKYEVVSDRLNLLLDPSISPTALAAVKDLAEAVSAGRISAEEAKRAAEKIHPKAGRLFDVANWSDQAKATLYAAIIGAAAVLGAAKIASSPNQTVTINPVIERVIERRKDDLLSSSSMKPIENPPLPRPQPKRRH